MKSIPLHIKVCKDLYQGKVFDNAQRLLLHNGVLSKSRNNFEMLCFQAEETFVFANSISDSHICTCTLN